MANLCDPKPPIRVLPGEPEGSSDHLPRDPHDAWRSASTSARSPLIGPVFTPRSTHRPPGSGPTGTNVALSDHPYATGIFRACDKWSQVDDERLPPPPAREASGGD